jgi:hypothetical protein
VQARAGSPFCGVPDALGPPCLTANVGPTYARDMKTSILALLAALVVMACPAQQPSPAKAESPSRESLAGGYVHGADKLYLTVRKDGTYSAGLGDCQGGDGLADGTWKVAGNQITFSPTNETTHIKGLLRKADVIRDGEHWAFVRPADRKLVKSKGLSFDTCLKNTAVLK